MAFRRAPEPRIFITGLGPVTCLGFGLERLSEGMSELGVVQGASRLAGGTPRPSRVIPAFELDRFVGAGSSAMDPQARCAMAAAALALDGAAVEPDEVDPLRCGVSLASVFGGAESAALFRKSLDRNRMRPASPVLFRNSLPDCAVGILSREFHFFGHSQNFCGDLLSGAQALESALLALRLGRADHVLAGGVDVAPADVLAEICRHASPEGPAPAQGAGLLLLETEDALERREGYAFCELGSAVCRGVAGGRSARDMGSALRTAIRQAMDEAGIWEGDVAMVFVSSGGCFHPAAAQAERIVLDGFSQVPTCMAKPLAGETFAVGFCIECAAAADALSSGAVPPHMTFRGVTRGVEFWVAQRPEKLMGDSALVVGCTPYLVAAAVLVAV